MRQADAIRYLSLAAKAGRLVTGGDEIEKAIRRGRGGLLVVASDAGASAVRRAGNLAAGRGNVTIFESSYTKSALASAVGRGSAAALVLVTDGGLASAFADAVRNGTGQEEKK